MAFPDRPRDLQWSGHWKTWSVEGKKRGSIMMGEIDSTSCINISKQHDSWEKNWIHYFWKNRRDISYCLRYFAMPVNYNKHKFDHLCRPNCWDLWSDFSPCRSLVGQQQGLWMPLVRRRADAEPLKVEASLFVVCTVLAEGLRQSRQEGKHRPQASSQQISPPWRLLFHTSSHWGDYQLDKDGVTANREGKHILKWSG